MLWDFLKDKILVFGSYGGNNSYNKGKDLLEESIKALHLESRLSFSYIWRNLKY